MRGPARIRLPNRSQAQRQCTGGRRQDTADPVVRHRGSSSWRRVRTVDVLPGPALDVADFLTALLFAGTMFGRGLGMRIRVLFPVPLRVLGLAASSTLVAATVSLGLTLALF